MNAPGRPQNQSQGRGSYHAEGTRRLSPLVSYRAPPSCTWEPPSVTATQTGHIKTGPIPVPEGQGGCDQSRTPISPCKQRSHGGVY